MIPLYWQKAKKILLMKVKEESEKVGLKLNGMQETPAGRKETKPSPDTEAARSPARRRPQHYPAACSHPSGGDARERSGWGFSQISLHHDAGGRGPGFSGLTRSTGHICRQERKRKGKRSEAQPSMAEGTRPLWGGSHRRRQSPRAPRLPFPQEDEDKGPHPSPRNPTSLENPMDRGAW